MAFLEYSPTQTLYKYCSEGGFAGILKSKCLWFSELTSLNDPRELVLGYSGFMKALTSLRYNEYRGDRGRFISVLIANLYRVHEDSQAFSTCFSLIGDTLPMWAAYGGNYRGLAIGFRPEALLHCPGRFQKVNYIHHTENDIRKQALLVAEFLIREPEEIQNGMEGPAFILALITSLKHASWSYEQEIRLVQVQERDDFHTPTYPGWIQPLSRQVENRDVRYVVVPFGHLESGRFNPRRAIEKVILGPNCDLTLLELNRTLTSLGFEDFTMEHSECRIR